MVKLEDEESSYGKKLVLGFDGGCFTCLELARSIDERVGDKLEIKNLRDPQVQEWRKRALGENAPWAPTLFEVNGTRVRAWTGLRMGLVLIRSLGPADTWRVMQAIGEMRPTKEKLIPGGFSRSQFLAGVGGAALAMTVLSGTGKLASRAAAHGNHHYIHGADLVNKARVIADTQDVRNVAGNDWADRVQAADAKRRCLPSGGCAIALATGDNCHIELVNNNKRFDAVGYCTIPGAVRHVNIDRDKRNVLSVAYAVPRDDWVIIYNEFDPPLVKKGRRIRTRAKLLRYRRDMKKYRLVRLSINGKPAKRGRRRR